MKDKRVTEQGLFVQISLAWTSVSGDKNASFLLDRYLSHRRFIFCFQKEKGKAKSPSCTCYFQVLLVQNNQFAKRHILRWDVLNSFTCHVNTNRKNAIVTIVFSDKADLV